MSSGNGVDTNWYVDSGAIDHITDEFDKLTMREKYGGRDQGHTTNGSGMSISNIGHTTLHTPICDLHLKNILYVPSANKSLVSVHCIAFDNNAFLEFHPNYFLIKDRESKTTLHQGRCSGGLYPLELNREGVNQSKQVLGVNKPSTSRWNSCLGHPVFPIVSRVLRDNSLPFVSDKSNESVRDSCQRAKSHQLPYDISNKRSASPLELIHSDVWGPAPTSAGRFSYYVSFIDDHTKYTWIYLLRKKSNVFAVFRDFLALVERKFNKQSSPCKQTGEQSMRGLIPSSNKLESRIMCLDLMLTNKMVLQRENIGI
jgi:hypothetical protein